MGSPLLDVSMWLGAEKQEAHKLKTLPVSANLNGGVDASSLRSLYMDFLDHLCFSPAGTATGTNRELIAARVSALCTSDVPARLVHVSSGIAALAYRFLPLESAVKIAHYTTLMFCMDDLSGRLKGDARERYLEDLTLFHMKLSNPGGYAALHPGRADLHPTLEQAIVLLKSELCPFFSTDNRRHTLLIKATLDFVEGNLLEQNYEAHPIDCTGVAELRLMPAFLRRKAGISELYASFVFMDNGAVSGTSRMTKEEESFFYTKLQPLIPELWVAIDFINDVLSYYKEVQDGEDSLCIIADARIHGTSQAEALAAYAQYSVDSRNRVVALADRAGSAQMKDRVVQFFQGYVAFHVGCLRYRLHEVLPHGWYKGEVYG